MRNLVQALKRGRRPWWIAAGAGLIVVIAATHSSASVRPGSTEASDAFLTTQAQSTSTLDDSPVYVAGLKWGQAAQLPDYYSAQNACTQSFMRFGKPSNPWTDADLPEWLKGCVPAMVGRGYAPDDSSLFDTPTIDPRTWETVPVDSASPVGTPPYYGPPTDTAEPEGTPPGTPPYYGTPTETTEPEGTPPGTPPYYGPPTDTGEPEGTPPDPATDTATPTDAPSTDPTSSVADGSQS